jgi:predicted nucleic acid-binding protein
LRGRKPPVVADASVLADWMRGVGAADRVDQLLRERRLATTSVAAFQVWAGLRTEAGRRQFALLLTGIKGRVFPTDHAAARQAGAIYAELDANGRRIDGPDCLIAAVALLRGCPVLTGNVRHFERVPRLTVLKA